MRFVCRNFGAPDLARRGLTADSAPLAVLLLDIEADFVISDDDVVVWSEDEFPVAELARALSFWLDLPEGVRGWFTFDSMAYDVPGAVRIVAREEDWRVGSVFAPDIWSSPVAWASLRKDLAAFVDAVRDQVIALGVTPEQVCFLGAATGGYSSGPGGA